MILASSVWIGGFVAIVIFSASSKKALGRPERIALFRQFGHRYVRVAGVAFVLVAVPGAVLLVARPLDGFTSPCWLSRSPCVVVTWIGVRQARAMGRMRKAGLAHPTTAPTPPRSTVPRSASVLRAGIGLLSLALFVLGVAMA